MADQGEALADIIQTALCLPSNAIAYFVSRQLSALCPNNEILEGSASTFDVEGYAAAGECIALDGFAANPGILTLATSNHPERLDAAILHRPSRFDRKYHFDLPGPAERAHYAWLWNDALDPSLRLTAEDIDAVVLATEDFSFAFMKELFLSATLRWMSAPHPGSLCPLLLMEAMALQAQMSCT